MSTQNWNAKEYATHSTAQLKWAKELIEKITIQGTESILDIGCGDGKITTLLAKKCSEGRVIGKCTPLHTGRRTQVWQIDITEEATGKRVAVSRITVAIIEQGTLSTQKNAIHLT